MHSKAGWASPTRQTRPSSRRHFRRSPATRRTPDATSRPVPLFGDTHLHTGFSMDAGAFGARLTPRDAYRFARGEEITSNTGQPVKLSRPLDFLVVADHSDGMGFFPQLMGGDPDTAGHAAGPQVVRPDQGRPGRRRGVRHHRELRPGPDAQGLPAAGHRGVPQLPGRRRSRPPRPTTSPAASPPSSASSGLRTPAATTCTAT